MTRLTITMLALSLAAAGAGCTIYPAEPASPTFTKDVQPILAAHCVRCHGAGNSLTNEADASKVGTIECYLDQLADRADCTTRVDGGQVPLTTCMPGAKFCATPLSGPGTKSYFDIYVFDQADTENRMPPPPAAPLNEWELNTLKRWVANGAPP
jgi:hypothetical protein